MMAKKERILFESHAPMWRVRDVIAHLGGVGKLSEKLMAKGFRPPGADTMQGWVTRNSIPSAWQLAVIGIRHGRTSDRPSRGAAAQGDDVMKWFNIRRYLPAEPVLGDSGLQFLLWLAIVSAMLSLRSYVSKDMLFNTIVVVAMLAAVVGGAYLALRARPA